MVEIEQTRAGGEAAVDRPDIDADLRAFMLGVYGKVTAGLVVSAALAWLTSSVPAIRTLLFHTEVSAGRPLLTLTALGLSVAFSPIFLIAGIGGATRAQRGGATLYWCVVAAIGASLGMFSLVYTNASIATAFLATATGFGALSIAGYIAQRDLSSAGSFLITGLVGLLAAVGLNMWLRSTALNFVVDGVGVIVFAGLIAFHTQKLKLLHHACREDEIARSAATYSGALDLYLDFVNMFQFLLSIGGARR